MNKKTKENSIIEPIENEIVSDQTLSINDQDIIEAEVINEEEWDENDNHPNFIESNTQAITLEELTTKNIIPTFSDFCNSTDEILVRYG